MIGNKIRTNWRKYKFWWLSFFIIGFLVVIINYVNSDSYTLMFKTYNLKYSDRIDDQVCRIERSRGLTKYILCNEKKGFYIYQDSTSNGHTEHLVNSFIVAGNTRIFKKAESSVTYYINGSDTLVISYEVSEGFLVNGELVRN